MEHLRIRSLLESPLVSATEVHCTAPRSECSEVESEPHARLILPLSGLFHWHVDRDTILADFGLVLLFNSDEEYRFSHPVAGGDLCVVLAPSPELLRDALADHGVERPDSAATPFSSRYAHLEPRAQHGSRLLRHLLSAGDALAREEAVVALLAAVTGSLAAGSPAHRSRLPQNAHRAVDSARMLLNSHPTEALKLDEIAHRVCCSPYHLARLFRIATGTSLHQYRLRLRTALALEALAEGANDLAGLALDLGFSHHSHFTATFRRLVGTTPAEIRDTLSHKRLHELRTILTANESTKPQILR